MKKELAQFLRNLAALLKVKTIITIAVITVFVILALNGTLGADVVMGIVTMVVAFYFGTQSEKNTNVNSNTKEEEQK